MKKILFLYNNYEREHIIIDIISKELEKYNNDIYKMAQLEKNVLTKIIKINPDIVVTYPITTYKQLELYKAVKMVCNCVMIAFTTEGLADLEQKDIVQTFAGHYDYSYQLIDYHIYWGTLFANKVGQELFKQKKISGSNQIRVFGNPMYEVKKIQKNYSDNKYVKKMKEDKNKKILILSGFHSSEYTKKDVIQAQDIVNINKTKKEIEQDEKVLKYLERFKQEKMYREKYISMIIDTANRNKDITFYIKLHPQEIMKKKKDRTKVKYLDILKNIENIVLIQESIPIGSILSFCSLLVHYGSTVDLEAYLYKIPTLKLEERNQNNPFAFAGTRITESTYYEDIDDKRALQKYIEDIRAGKNLFRSSELAEKRIYEFMNYKKGKRYCPSEKIAAFLNSDLKKYKLKVTFKDWKEIFLLLCKENKNK